MRSRTHRLPAHALAAAALLASLACRDQTVPTAPQGDAGEALAALRPIPLAPTITALTLKSTTLRIGGPGTPYVVTVLNPLPTSVPGVLLQGEIVQGLARRAAGGFIAHCPAPNGVLPPGACTMSFTATASNKTAGTGTLVPGHAAFVLKLIRSTSSGSVVLHTRTVPVRLVIPAPTISSLTPSRTILGIDGSSVTYNVTVQNPTGVAQPEVFLQGEMVQGSARRGAGGFIANCPTPDGVLPPAGCTMQFTVTASNAAGGIGTLVPGPASFVLTLYQGFSGTPVQLDSRTVAVTLVDGPVISSLSLSSPTVVIGGPGTPYTVSVLNPFDTTETGVFLQGYIVQGSTLHAAGGFIAHCPAPDQTLPAGICTMSFTVNASGGAGAPLPGSATFVLELLQSTGGPTVKRDTRSVGITLVAQ